MAAHFLTPRYLVCLQHHTVQLLTLDFLHEVHALRSSDTDSDDDRASHFWGRKHVSKTQFTIPLETGNFRGAAFSESVVVQNMDLATVSTTLLAYDVLRGLYHFSIKATLHSPGAASTSNWASSVYDTQNNSVLDPLDMTVSLLAAHHMAQLVSRMPGDDVPPRGGYTRGSRGFISTCALGAQGKRGIWIERQRNSIGRSVFGFSTKDYELDGVDGDGGRSPYASMDDESAEFWKDGYALRGRCMYEVRNTYDLRGLSITCADVFETLLTACVC